MCFKGINKVSMMCFKCFNEVSTCLKNVSYLYQCVVSCVKMYLFFCEVVSHNDATMYLFFCEMCRFLCKIDYEQSLNTVQRLFWSHHPIKISRIFVKRRVRVKDKNSQQSTCKVSFVGFCYLKSKSYIALFIVCVISYSFGN